MSHVLAERLVFVGRVLRLVVDTVELPNGRRAEMEVVRHAGASAMVPLLDDGRVVLVRQYRHAVGRWLLEVPAGTLGPGETPEACARRETIESCREFDYTAARLASAVSKHSVDVFRKLNSQPGRRDLRLVVATGGIDSVWRRHELLWHWPEEAPIQLLRPLKH